MKRLNLILILTLISVSLFAQSNEENKEVKYNKDIKLYFVVELTPNANIKIASDKRMKIQKEHMRNIQELVMAKKLVMAGPFPTGGGLFFMSTDSEEEAEKLIKKDPTVKAKLNTYAIRPWMTERGLFTLDNKAD